MSKKFGLGKGLNALIPEDTVILEPKKGKDKNDDNGYSLIDINLIKSNESQPRKSFDDEKIMELAESIKSNGIIQPLILRKDKDGIKRDYEKVCEQFPILKERMNQDASTLSGGEQQMLAMGRALMAKPKLLLLDEPSMGLAPILVKEIFNIIEEINKSGTTVLLVEQNAKMALSIAHRAYVLETGKVVMSGTGEELAKSPDVQKAYLGG